VLILTTHRVDQRGTLYRSRAYRRTSRLLWLAIVVPVVAVLGVVLVLLALADQAGVLNLSLPWSSLSLSALLLGWFGTSLPTGLAGPRRGREAIRPRGRIRRS